MSSMRVLSMLALLLALGVAVQGQSSDNLEGPLLVAGDDQALAVSPLDTADPTLADQLGDVQSTQQEDDGSLEIAAMLWKRAKREAKCIYKKKLVDCKQSQSASDKSKHTKNALKVDCTAGTKYEIEGPADDDDYPDSKAHATKHGSSSSSSSRQSKDISGDKYDSKHGSSGGSSHNGPKGSAGKQTGSGSSQKKARHADSDSSSYWYGDDTKYSSSSNSNSKGSSGSSSSGSKSNSSSKSKGDHSDKSDKKSTQHDKDESEEYWQPPVKHNYNKKSTHYKEDSYSNSKTDGYKHTKSAGGKDDDNDTDNDDGDFWQPPNKHVHTPAKRGKSLINSLVNWAVKYANYAETLVQEPGLVKPKYKASAAAEQQ